MFKDYKKKRFFDPLLQNISRPLGFIDVGSGGPLKRPWSLLPANRIRKFDVDPETTGGLMPICISDREGTGVFHVAVDPRSSSLQPPNKEYAARFGNSGILTARTIEVRLQTLSDAFGHLENSIDMIDINVEGHDARVLKGAGKVFQSNFIKLVKIEYELATVWIDQDWFGEIDKILREGGYDLVTMQNEEARPVSVSNLNTIGEVVWGKAIYVASLKRWKERVATWPDTDEECRIGICLYTAFDLPARALEICRLAEERNPNFAISPNALYGKLVWLYGNAWFRIAVRTMTKLLPSSLRAALRQMLRSLISS